MFQILARFRASTRIMSMVNFQFKTTAKVTFGDGFHLRVRFRVIVGSSTRSRGWVSIKLLLQLELGYIGVGLHIGLI